MVLWQVDMPGFADAHAQPPTFGVNTEQEWIEGGRRKVNRGSERRGGRGGSLDVK